MQLVAVEKVSKLNLESKKLNTNEAVNDLNNAIKRPRVVDFVWLCDDLPQPTYMCCLRFCTLILTWCASIAGRCGK